MKALLLPAVALLASTPAAARSPFDGRWVADLDSQAGLGSDRYLVAKGLYRCDSCTPPRHYRADGRPHRVPGDAQITSEAVTVTGPRTIVTRIVSPSITRVTTMTVAPDDRTATYVSLDERPGVKGPLRTVYLARRKAPAPRGAHPVSGTWRGVRYVEVPEEVRTTELHIEGMVFIFRTPLGYSFTAGLGGGMVPVQGPYKTPGFASVRAVDEQTIEEKRFAAGKLLLVRTYRLLDGGDAMEIATTDSATGRTFRITAHRK